MTSVYKGILLPKGKNMVNALLPGMKTPNPPKMTSGDWNTTPVTCPPASVGTMGSSSQTTHPNNAPAGAMVCPVQPPVKPVKR